MFAGMKRRIISIWLPRLPSERWRRRNPGENPCALTLKRGNSEMVYCLSPQAERAGIRIGMTATQARTLCHALELHPADPAQDARILEGLRRWAQAYAAWVVCDGADGLLLDITGAAHLQGGEAPLWALLNGGLQRMGFTPRIGLADTRGAAWALAHFAPSIAEEGQTRAALSPLPVAALRYDAETVTALQRLGLRQISDLLAAARAPLTRRFGPDLLMRLDQALGTVAEPMSPHREAPSFHETLIFAEPIGLLSDLTEGLRQLLHRLCAELMAQLQGARTLELRLQRVDKETLTLPLRLAAPMREATRILPLFARHLDTIDSGFGIDRMELRATLTESLPLEQLGPKSAPPLADLLTRIGTRIGLENIHCFAAQDSHWPERSFSLHPATVPLGPQNWPKGRKRPLKIFPPEAIQARGPTPPQTFRWRAMPFTTAQATGPERITPEWWASDAPLRDYWHIQTHQGRRLWLFYTPQQPNWYVQGEFA